MGGGGALVIYLIFSWYPVMELRKEGRLGLGECGGLGMMMSLRADLRNGGDWERNGILLMERRLLMGVTSLARGQQNGRYWLDGNKIT